MCNRLNDCLRAWSICSRIACRSAEQVVAAIHALIASVAMLLFSMSDAVIVVDDDATNATAAI